MNEKITLQSLSLLKVS